VLRPAGARKALRGSPTVETGGAYTARIKCVPGVAAATRPHVILSGRPAAERALDTRAGGLVALILFRLAINNNGGLVVCDGTHAPIL
jgi:hypothetical protein